MEIDAGYAVCGRDGLLLDGGRPPGVFECWVC